MQIVYLQVRAMRVVFFKGCLQTMFSPFVIDIVYRESAALNANIYKILDLYHSTIDIFPLHIALVSKKIPVATTA